MTRVHRLEIRLFGELDLRLDDQRLAPLESARARSLLAYLLLHDDAPQSRQRVAFLLWPDSTEGQARTNLRHLLHTLRRAIPELDRFLEATPHTLRWRREAPYWLDVAAFASALARADAPGSGTDDELTALQEAVSYYAGDLLDGSYDESLVEERERLRDYYVAALRRLTTLLANRGEHAEAIRLGRELLRGDRLHEDTYQLLMRVHHAAGDRAGAVRVYHECVSELQRELGVGPSAATLSAYAVLMRSETENAEPRPEPGPEPEPIDASELVGRDTEWEQLTECWRQTERGRARLVLVTGEPGVGKSRLVEELAMWCAHRGALVATARSYPAEGELGYGVAISWLRSSEVEPQLRQAAPSDLTELSRLLPDLADISDAAEPTAVDASEQKRRLFDALARTLVASGRSTLLIADDAQWCDAPSLQLIHYLLRLGSDSRLLVVATVRREDLEDDHPLVELSAGLEMIDRTLEIALDRLTHGATEKLARQLADGPLDANAIDTLFAETEGNPLFLVEMMRAGWDKWGREESSLPPKLWAVISTRLRLLSGTARDLLGMAATVGRDFTTDVLAQASSIDDIAFVRGLDELWRRGIIRERGVDAYDFGHGKIRDVAYASLSPAARRRNHLLIADTLVKLRHSNLDLVSGELARHYDRGGRVVEALMWYQRAAVQAQRLHANIEAVRLLDQARALIAASPNALPTRDQELEILSLLVTPLAVAEGFASTRLAQVQREAFRLADALGVEPEPQLLRSIAMSNLCRADFDGARTDAQRLHRSAVSVGDDVQLIESRYLSGIAAFWNGEFDSARQYLEEVVEQFRPEQRTEHVLRFGHDPKVVCLSRLANTLWFLGHSDDARRARDGAVAMAREVAHPFSRGVAYIFAAVLCVDLGETAHYDEYVDGFSADLHDQAWHDITSGAFQGYADVLHGRVDEGIGRIRTMIDTAPPIDQAPAQRALLMRLLMAAYDSANLAEEGLRAADVALSISGSRIWEAEIRRLRAEFLAELGATPLEVEEEFVRARDVARRQGATGLERLVARSPSRLR